MATTFLQLRIEPVSAAYWRVVFDHPPINLVDPQTILELQALVGLIEDDTALKVVVFESAHPDFFLARFDLSRAAELPVAPGPTGQPTWVDLTLRLARSRVVSIAKVRGRARSGQRVLPCLRSALRERGARGVLPAGSASWNPSWRRCA
jgi:enoyl-CoA hydratase/carnithine racemase